MILDAKPLSMPEALEYVGDSDSDKEVKSFLKKFTTLDAAKAKELKKKLEELDLVKVNENHIVKIIDLLPVHTDDLNKIFVGVSLDEDENQKILTAINS